MKLQTVPQTEQRSSPTATSRSGLTRWPRPSSAATAPALVVGLLAGVVFATVRTGLIDDAYITLTYARTLAEHGDWGIVPGMTANSATIPLVVLLLAAGITVVDGPVVALGILFVICAISTTYCLQRTASAAGLPQWSGILGSLLALLNPLVLSSLGMGVAVFAALLSLLLLAAVERRPVLFGVAGGLLALARLDLVLFVLVLLAAQPRLWRGWWKSALALAAVSLPWFVVSWIVLGSAIPDTLVIKLFAGWGMWNFTNGWQLYLGKYPFYTVVSAIGPVLGLLGMLAWIPARVRAARRVSTSARLDTFAGLAAGGVAYYIAYTQLGVSPYHWYYAPTITALSIGAAVLIGWATNRTQHVFVRWIALSTAMTSAAFTALLFAVVGLHGTPWAQPPIISNGFTAADYARMGQELHKRVGSATVGSADEIGTLAYFCHCTITDGFADRGYIPDQIRQREEQLSPTFQWLLRLNYRYYDRSQTPRPLDYQLHRVPGPGPDPAFTGSSSWAAPNHFELQDLHAPTP